MRDTTVESAVLDWIVGHEAETVDLIRELVRQPSIPGLEYGAQQLVRRHLIDLGLAASFEEINSATLVALPGFSDTGRGYANRPNVVARWPGDGGGRTLILTSHIDVVPIEEDSGWTHDPWGGEVVGKRLYGRGAWDDKPGIALILMVLRALRAQGVRLRGGIEVLSVPDEEGGGNATLALCASGHRADAALFVDGVGCAALTGFTGLTCFRVTVRTTPTPGLSQQRGANPIRLAEKLIVALYDLADGMNDAFASSYGGTDRPIQFNVGQIHSGAWVNSVPSHCVFEGQINFLPSRGVAWAQDQVRRAIADTAAMDPWLRDHQPELRFVGVQAEGCHDTSNAELVDLLGAAHKSVWGVEMRTRQILGFVDTRHYSAYGIPSICYGPSGANAHCPDEYLDLETLMPTARVIALFVLRWCGLAP
jgi:acetylornithine deacetylase